MPISPAVSVRIKKMHGANNHAHSAAPRQSKVGLDKMQNLLISRHISKKQRRKNKVKEILDSKLANVLIITISLWSLFGNDVRVSSFTKSADLGFDIVTIIMFVIFCCEITANVYCREDYFSVPDLWNTTIVKTTALRTWARRLQLGSFYFWLDCIATLSLILEVTNRPNVVVSNDQNTALFIQVGNALRAGARASRIVRIFRIIKWIKLTNNVKETAVVAYAESQKVLKKYLTKRNSQNEAALERLRMAIALNPNAHMTQNIKPKDAPKPMAVEDDMEKSRVGIAMTDLMNKRVVTLVIILLVIIPLLVQRQTDYTFYITAEMIQTMAMNHLINSTIYDSSFTYTIEQVASMVPIVSVKINGVYYLQKQYIIDQRRHEDLKTFQIDPVTVLFDDQISAQNAALFSIYETLFVTMVLVIGTYFMSSDVNKLIINPIERLVDLVRQISANPLGVEYKMLGEKEGFVAGMETTILLTTINRIGRLMQVGFGEAGKVMIAGQLKSSSTGESGQLNFMGAGHQIQSIFGFADVRQFTDTTECLQEEVMLFVNRIAYILHDIVVQCSGSANKNIGDAFLLAWKLDDVMTDQDVTRLADQALLAFCKTLIELSRYQRFICNFSAAATERLAKRFPNYEVRIGSGLHVGWAIEGAIGSNRKIDASYLSPHVNFTEFLESSTKEYGVPLLFSEQFYNLLSSRVKKLCRQVDRIRRSREEDPVGLFVYDFDMTIDWNDPIRRGRRDALNAILERDRHMAAMQTRQPSRRDVRRSSTSMAPNGMILVSSGRDRTGSVRVNPIGTTPFSASMGSNNSEYTERRRSQRYSGDMGQPVHFQYGAGSSGKINEQDERNMLLHHQVLNPTINRELHGTNTNNHLGGVNSHRSESENSRRVSMSNAGSQSQKSNVAGGGQSIRVSRRESREVSVHISNSKQPFAGGGGGGGEGLLNRAPSMHHMNPLARQQSQHMGVAREGRRRTSFMVGHGLHDNTMSPDGDDHNTPSPDGSKNPVFLIPEYNEEIWDDDPDLVEARHLISDSFRQQWEKGIQAYIKGDWQKARDIFHEIGNYMSNGQPDGPSKFLMQIIDDHGGTKPLNWAEYRMEGGGH